MNYDDDTMLREYNPNYRDPEPSRFKFYLVIGSIFSISLMLFASAKGYLPHYTLMIDGNKWEWVRDDANYLASLPPKPLDEVDLHNQKIIAQNKAEFEARQAEEQKPQYVNVVQSDIESSVQHQQTEQVMQTGGIQKCLNAAGRAVYQEQDCALTGLKPVKTLSQAELTVSRADAQSTAVLRRSESNYTPSVATISVDEKRNSAYCRDIEYQRENIRSQQRIDSRQWHRDEYTRLSKLWQSECLS